MPAVYINLTEHDATAGQNVAAQYGPASVGGGNTITKIQVIGHLASPPITTTTGIIRNLWLQLGIQHGALGYTPTSPESIPTPGSEWLDFQCSDGVAGSVVSLHNAPGSDDSAAQRVNLLWIGQLLTPNGTDIYFSVGRFFNPGVNYYFQGSMVVTYA